MLDTQEVANYLQDKLNEIGTGLSSPLTFDILSEVGTPTAKANVHGIIRSLEPSYTPVSGYTEGRLRFVVEFVLSTGNVNAFYRRVNSVISEMVKETQAARVVFSEGVGIVTLTTGVPRRFDVNYGFGEGVPLAITVNITYAEGATLSADKHWLLDGQEIPFLRESVSVEQDGMQRKVFTEKYTKTILTGHTKYYTFSIPYDTQACKALQQEIMQNASVTHTLSYYDGAAYTQANPFTTDVVIFRSARSSAEMPNGSLFDVIFTDAYDSVGKALQYSLALIDFPFDMNGEDTRYFASQAEQQAYFEQKAAASSAPFVEIDAPTLDNLMITRQVYKNSTDGMSQFDYVSKNYAIVKVTSASATKYFYYFIENCTTGSDGQVIVDLKMDTVQTYFFDPNVTFSDCLIERAHLNRFTDAGGGNVKFVSDPATKIFNAEEGMNFPKRMVKRTKLDLQYVFSNAQVNEWLNENIDYWVYVFIDPSAEYTYGLLEEGSTSLTTTTLDGKISYPVGFNGATKVLCYPVYKNYQNSNIIKQDEIDGIENVIKIVNTNLSQANQQVTIIPHQSAESTFRTGNSNTSYFYSKKISILPPFDMLSASLTDTYIDDNNNLVIESESGGVDESGASRKASIADFTYGEAIKPGYRIQQDSATIVSSSVCSLFISSNQTRNYIQTQGYSLAQNAQLAKSAITAQQAPNPAYNPKLNGQNFKELIITAAGGDSFTYDIQKIANSTIYFNYSEPIVPEITRYYMRLSAGSDGTGLYSDQTDENFMGLVGSIDSSLAFVNDQFASFIANNRNFFLQSDIKIATNALQGIGRAMGSFSEGNSSEGITGVAGAVVSAELAKIDRSLTVDNMKNAPDQMKNANGNVILNLFATDLGLYVEEYSALDGDLKTANDFMDLYGFTFSSVANVKDYANIRKYHNYIKAQLQSVDGNLSNAARRDLRDRFANGVRFWNSDTVSYAYENYENWLDN